MPKHCTNKQAKTVSYVQMCIGRSKNGSAQNKLVPVVFASVITRSSSPISRDCLLADYYVLLLCELIKLGRSLGLLRFICWFDSGFGFISHSAPHAYIVELIGLSVVGVRELCILHPMWLSCGVSLRVQFVRNRTPIKSLKGCDPLANVCCEDGVVSNCVVTLSFGLCFVMPCKAIRLVAHPFHHIPSPMLSIFYMCLSYLHCILQLVFASRWQHLSCAVVSNFIASLIGHHLGQASQVLPWVLLGALPAKVELYGLWEIENLYSP